MVSLIFRKIGDISAKTLKIINGGVIALLVSILASNIFDIPQRKPILWVIIFFTLLASLFVLVKLVFNYMTYLFLAISSKILGQECNCVWEFIGEDGTLNSFIQYTIKNMSLHSQSTLITDADGFRIKPPNFRPIYTCLRRSSNLKSKVESIGDIPFAPDSISHPDQGVCFRAEWGVRVQPILKSFESISFARESIDKEVEPEAFTEHGTIFKVKPRLYFKRLKMSLIAPLGFHISDLKILIDDQEGIIFNQKQKLCVNQNGKLMNWEVRFPNPALRYNIAFRLIRNASSD